MVRVLIIGFTENLGGVESLIYTYYQHIDRSVMQFDFLVNVAQVPFQKEIEQLGGRVYSIPQKTKDYFGYNRELKRFFEEHAKEYEVFWFNSNSLANLDYLVYAQKYGIPKRIVHSHNTLETRGTVYKLFHNRNRKKAKKLATDYWACSEDAGRFFYDENTLKSSHFHIINNAINLNRFKSDSDKRLQWRKQLGISDDALVLGNVGRLSYQKNHKFLIEAFAQVVKKKPDSVLLLIGTGELQEEISEQIKSLGVADNVQLLGQQSDVAGIMQAMDAFVMPSHYEGLPISGIEAQAAGLPCLFSDAITRKLKMSENSEFLPIDNPSVWSEAMLRQTDKERTDNSEHIRAAGYDIELEAQTLMKLLLED
ncbi:MAG: glycosyltransferase family 1 protein [Ruminococcus sp.]|nr:glycosyltransferase family 1 protein [Ruminococcus sp.]